jgi:hypothetical protein
VRLTLVGIAGEDDLDAPDLAGQPAEGTPKAGNGFNRGEVNGSGAAPFAKNRKPWAPPKASLRDRLVGELSGLASADDSHSTSSTQSRTRCGPAL